MGGFPAKGLCLRVLLGPPPPWASRKKEVWIRDILSPCVSISVCLSFLSTLPSFRHPLTHPFFFSFYIY